MLQSIGAQVALLTFAFAVIAGISAGNSPITILTRGMISMIAALFVGQTAAAVCKAVLRDHLQRRKHRIDSDHVAAIEAATADIPVAGSLDDVEGSQGGVEQ